LLIEIIDEKIKKTWLDFEIKYKSARKLIENVEMLSNRGLSALDNRSYRKSLDIYEEIINQLQNYSK
jgi:hypothetical protein